MARSACGLVAMAGMLAAACVVARLVVVAKGRGRIVAAVVPATSPLAPTLTGGSEPFHVEVVAILGAGMRPDGTPTAVLAQRVEAGVDLYLAGHTDRLIMSGFNNRNGDQPGAMRDLAVARGVPTDDIALDYEGVNTAATCRGLKRDYGQVPVALVTQEFHAARTAVLAAKAGLDAVVVATPDAAVRPKALRKARLRELPASIKALFVDRP